jgi:hypothetical protein
MTTMWPGMTRVASLRGHRHVQWNMRTRHSFHGVSPHARAAIVGGNSTSIEQAPWQATVLSAVPIEENGKVEFVIFSCGGSILDATHILTTAACVYDPITLTPLPATNVAIVAGVSNLSSTTEPNEQFREASGLRVHPYFNYSAGPGTPDDIAVVTLSNALTLSSAAGTAVNSIGLAGSGATPAVGANVDFTGFGRETASGSANGSLNSLSMSLEFPRRCGGEADAVFLCASAPTGSACTGDAGSGLTIPGAGPTLVGIMDTVEVVSGSHCANGATASFVNVTAPEIQDFISGSETPPEAPRGGDAIEIAGVPVVGHSLTCSPGSWSGEPVFTYNFVNSAGEQVLQSSSSPTYQLTTADVGRTIACELQATNAGGTGAVRTSALPPIEAEASSKLSGSYERPNGEAGVFVPSVLAQRNAESIAAERKAKEEAEARMRAATAKAPTGEVSLAGTAIEVQGDGVALVKLDCAGSESCTGKLALSATSRAKGKRQKSRTITIGTDEFLVADGATNIAHVKLDAAGRKLLANARQHLAARLEIQKLTPAPEHTLIANVHLAGQKLPTKR